MLTAGYDSIIYQYPRAPAGPFHREVPLRSRWGTLCENDDDAPEKDDQTTTCYGPEECHLSAAGIGNPRQKCNNSQLGNTKREDARAETGKRVKNGPRLLVVVERGKVTPVASCHSCDGQTKHKVTA